MTNTHVLQNQDINVGPHNYAHLAPDVMLVTSIFYTVQGEGPYAGAPAIFIRLAGCNRGRKVGMGCEFCDTAFHYNQGNAMRFADIVAAMHDTLVTFPKVVQPMVVITGGEPMMQNNLGAFCTYLVGQGWKKIQIESNGDRLVRGLPDFPLVTLVVSPKVSKVAGTKDQWEYKEPNSDVYGRVNFWKFVVDHQLTSPYGAPPPWAKASCAPVYISPLTHYKRPLRSKELADAWDHSQIDVEKTKLNYFIAATLARWHGYRVSMQQHLFFGVP